MLTLRMLLALALLTLAGCSGISPLSLLTGGGPNVAANTQLGQENEQTIGPRTSTDQTIVRPQARDITQVADKNEVKSESINEVKVQNVPPWVLFILVLGWLFPSPGEIGRCIRNLLKGGK